MTARRLNLTALLAIVALLELGANRILGRLFMPMPRPNTFAVAALGQAGAFLHHLAASLGLVLFAIAFTRAIRQHELFPRSMRMTACLFALFFLCLAVPGTLLAHIPPRLFVHLKTSQAFLAWMIALGALRTFAPRRAKAGIVMLALPSVLHAIALFSAQMGWNQEGQFPIDLFRAGEIAALTVGAASPLLLSPRPFGGPARVLVATWGAGAAALALVTATMWANFDLVQMVALYGLRLDVPSLVSPEALAYAALLALAFLGLTTAVLQCLIAGGSARLVGYGLILIASAGHQVSSVGQLVLSSCGLLAVALGIGRSVRPAAMPVMAAPEATMELTP